MADGQENLHQRIVLLALLYLTTASLLDFILTWIRSSLRQVVISYATGAGAQAVLVFFW
jgi:hypothetical protein